MGTKENPGKSCKDILANGGTKSKIYYIQSHVCCVHLVYCDQTTAGGGWTLVYSYTFTNFKFFNNFTNGITPRPSWQAPGDVPVSTTPPLRYSIYFFKKLIELPLYSKTMQIETLYIEAGLQWPGALQVCLKHILFK